MHKYDIVILTEDRYDNNEPKDQNERDILIEDTLIKESFEKLGLRVYRTSWANPNFDWASTKAAFFSTTWDYHFRYDEFMTWFKDVRNKCLLLNSYDTINWNLDKHYLNELQEAGINTPESIFIEKGETTSLKTVYKNSEWNETVLKPIVSAGGRHTYRINENNLSEYEELFTKLLAEEGLMLQEFQKNVISKGEVAYMIMGETYTHAILKTAKKGDFRVQDDFGGSLEVYIPSQKEIDFATEALIKSGHKTTYARVDVIYDNNDQLSVSELELMEPELWFRFDKPAADVLAKVVLKALNEL